MRSSFLIILLICIAFSKSENDIILSNMSKEKNWIYKYETSDNISVYKLNNDSFPIIKLSKELDNSYSSIFQTILSIEKYDSIISNKSFSTKQINKNNNSDTVYVYQKIKNIIPFIKNRQIIFKLFKSSDNRLSWKLLKSSDNLFEEFCDVCGQKDGAVVHCSIPSCKFKFHPSCGKKEGFYMCIERLSGQNSEKIQLAAFCKKHTHKKRSSKLTGKDVEIWLPYEKRWSKARVGYFRPRDNIHTVAYHEDGVVEEIYTKNGANIEAGFTILKIK